MDMLPIEIFTEILGYLPPASCKDARLTSRQFNAVLAAPTFDRLRAFLDPDTAMDVLRGTLHDLPARPRAMWSPHCSVPETLPLPRSFLHAMYTALGGQRRLRTRAVPSRLELVDSSSDESGSEESETELRLEEDDDEEEDGDMSVAVMLQRLGRPEVSEQMLRQALFRYALYKSYVYDGEGEAPQLWVMNPTRWKYQL